MGRCCLWGTAGWDRPGALWRHCGRPVAQPRFPGDRPTRFGSSRFWAVSAGGSMSSRARWFCTTGGYGRATPTQYLPPAGPAGRPGISRHQSRTLADTHHNSLTQFPSARGHQSHTQSRHAQSPHRLEGLPVARAAVGHGRLAASNTVGLHLRRVESILAKSISLWSWARIWKSPASGQDGRLGRIDLVQVDFGRFWPEPEGLLLRRVKPIFGQVTSRPTGDLADELRFTPALRRAADAPDRLRSRRARGRCTHLDVCLTSMVISAISSEVDFTWPKSARLARSCRPTAPSESSRLRPS